MSCYLTGLCGVNNASKCKTVIEEPVLTPYVSLTIVQDTPNIIRQAFQFVVNYITGTRPQTEIGFGNGSYPAAITSFQYGLSTGCGAEIEITDEEGGEFAKVFDRLTREGSASGNFAKLKFGWISGSCTDSGLSLLNSINNYLGTSFRPGDKTYISPVINLMIQTVTAEFKSGVCKYKLHCIDLIRSLDGVKMPTVIGTPERPVTLKQAIIEVMKERNVTVKFVRFNNATEYTDLVFAYGGSGIVDPKEGPKQVWRGSDKPVLEVIKEWLRPEVAKAGITNKGIKIIYDPLDSSLVCVVDIPDYCVGSVNENFNIGSYVVNGGNCSPVIEFKPDIQWIAASMAYATGGTVAGNSPSTQASKGPLDCLGNNRVSPHLYGRENNHMRVGPSLSITMNEGELAGRLAKALGWSYSSTYLNNVANIVFGGGITAELVIQGDPSYVSPFFLIGRTVSLIVMNPYSITGTNTCDWKTTDKPNNVLTNNNWLIQGVTHTISSGVFRTTMKLSMLTPGQNAPFRGIPGGSIVAIANAIRGAR